MILVDSSAWIAVLRREGTLDLRAKVDPHSIVTCLPVIQEVLQGFRAEEAWRQARIALLSFKVIESPLRLEVYEEAIALSRQARRAGLTIRSTQDCLIAACALRNDLEVVHIDRDFTALARICGLRQRQL
jgi:predicted nucleic acid-binding protein